MADIQAQFDKLMALAKSKTLEHIPQLTLGRLIDALEEMPFNARILVERGDRLFSYGELDSYRGYYSDLCIEPGGPVEGAGSVVELRSDLIDAVGKTFEGYKGGDYTMGHDTLMWVDHYGMCDGYAVTGVRWMLPSPTGAIQGCVIVETTLVD